ncbi:hypothetical protein GUY44_28830 [Pimelobacter simplex]|uniref:Uncharacterized protein n=1 Tax=Nocardioides simplex TaxID=2045 RepID=A0A0A1DH79_NOCSI|nr:hypothetical protein [Pimelobacter simplex]AIY15883.1 hypothetical protein KR76_02225 [Pimelobacter simplex]MCG8154508.1 hypothetical protein [Pimelobacter simplex]GEB12558.1 hypothetical protein NSI01_08730 [Pimelobacter simplex]SFM93327.1 hypothetical protein SAMN05421671_4171 [Pimelobacter simplex]
MDAGADSHAEALRDFTRFSTGSAVWLALVGVSGLGYAATLGTSDRQQVRLVGLVVGAGLVLVALRYLAGLVLAWRRDLRSVSLVAGDRPECASGGPAMFYEGYVSWRLVLVGLVVAVLGVVVVPSAADGAAWGWATPVGLGLVAVSLVAFVRWRGNEYVGVHAEELRMLRGGRLSVAPWSRVLSFENGQVGIEGMPDRAGVDGEVETRIRERAVAAGLATFDARLRAGESVDLGAVTLERSVLVLEGEPIRWDEIDSVGYEHDGENNWTHVVVRGRHRRQRAKVMESGIANLPVLQEALRTYTGLRFADPR